MGMKIRESMYPNGVATLVTCSVRHTSEMRYLAQSVAFGLTVIADALRIIEEFSRRSM
jgi:hypothetical protein